MVTHTGPMNELKRPYRVVSSLETNYEACLVRVNNLGKEVFRVIGKDFSKEFQIRVPW